METVPYLDLRAQYRALRSEVLRALEEICESTAFAQGPATSKFEAEFAAYCGIDHCVSLNSGTSALHLALRCLDVGPGDEVVTVSMTFIATAWAISYVGATPVFVDIDPVRRTLNPDKLEAAITSRTKAIIPVHLYGMPAEMDRIMAIAEQHGVPVIEDAAQAHGARYQGRRVGQFGQIACFSFYPGKNLGAYGEGGALITNDASIARRARSLRDHAQSQKYYGESHHRGTVFRCVRGRYDDRRGGDRARDDPSAGGLATVLHRPGHLALIGAITLYAALTAVLGVGVAALLRHSAGAVAVLLLWPLLVRADTGNLPSMARKSGVSAVRERAAVPQRAVALSHLCDAVG